MISTESHYRAENTTIKINFSTLRFFPQRCFIRWSEKCSEGIFYKKTVTAIHIRTHNFETQRRVQSSVEKYRSEK